MSIIRTLTFFAPLLYGSIIVGAQPLEKIYTTGERLSYRGYTVTRTFNSVTGKSYVVVKRGRKILARHSQGEGLGMIDSSHIGLFPFLGGQGKQLIIEQSSGGAHCCYSRWIYELTPSFKLIFNSDSYDVSDGFGKAELADLDRDGVTELILSSNHFAYFHLHFSASPLPTIIFKYNRKTHQYDPANPLFPKYVLKDITVMKRDALNNAPYNFAWVLAVMLDYIYAGREAAAWRFYDRTYTLNDKASIRREIKATLRQDHIYRFIKAHYPHESTR